MKVAIIGAGIAGLYLAWKLSGKGHKVTVFEKRDRIGKEACSGLFSERILDFIPQLRRKVGAPKPTLRSALRPNVGAGTSESKKFIQNEINFVLIHFPKKTIRVDFKRKFFVMSHAELDRLAADLAQNTGAEIVLNCIFRESDMTIHSVLPTRLSLRQVQSCTWLRSGSPHPNPSVHSHIALSSFDRVIGCDGAKSAVRKSLGLPEPSYRLGILGFINVTRSDPVSFVETWPVKNGFIWKIPRGKEIEYGIIASLDNARKFLDDFCLKNNLRLQNIKSALIPQGFLIPKNNKITLCGDAAGLTKPWSGGGVIWGLTAADLLLKNFPDLLRYRQDAGRAFHWKILLSKFLTKAVYFLGDKLPWLLPGKIKIDGDKLL